MFTHIPPCTWSQPSAPVPSVPVVASTNVVSGHQQRVPTFVPEIPIFVAPPVSFAEVSYPGPNPTHAHVCAPVNPSTHAWTPHVSSFQRLLSVSSSSMEHTLKTWNEF